MGNGLHWLWLFVWLVGRWVDGWWLMWLLFCSRYCCSVVVFVVVLLLLLLLAFALVLVLVLVATKQACWDLLVCAYVATAHAFQIKNCHMFGASFSEAAVVISFRNESKGLLENF